MGVDVKSYEVREVLSEEVTFVQESERGEGEHHMGKLEEELSRHRTQSERQESVMDKGGLACCDSRGRKESDTTERLN